ncbi:MAG: hypothetical protein JKY19_01240, partial [Alcanivoracaceae bacterium]|nr:hypothetical protein [Alcanivoracaceae bacterium]
KGYSTKYLAGEQTESTKRLDNIIIRTPIDIHRTYDFIYNDSSSDNMLLLDKVTEKAGSTTRTLLETIWQGDNAYKLIKPQGGDLSVSSLVVDAEMASLMNKESITMALNSNQVVSEGEENAFTIVSMRVGSDINGDGSKEILAGARTPLNAFKYSLLFYDTTGGLKGEVIINGDGSALSPTHITNNGAGNADFNGDGITDMLFNPILSADLNTFQVAIWKGVEFDDVTTPEINMDDLFRFVDTGIPASLPTPHEQLSPNSNMTAVDFDGDGYQDVLYTRLVDYDLCWSIDANGNGNPTTQLNNGNCDNNVYYRRHLGLTSCPNNETSCSRDPIFGGEVYITTIDFNIIAAQGLDTLSIKDLNADGHPDLLISNGRFGLRKVEFFNGTDNAGIFQFNTLSVEELGISDLVNDDDNGNTLKETFYLLTDLNGDGLDDFLYVADPVGITTPAEWKYQLNTGKYSATDKLFTSPPESTGLSGHAAGLPDTTNDCNMVEYGGVANNPFGDGQKCSPRRANGLLLTDVNADGINDLLLPDPDKVLIDVCMQVLTISPGTEEILFDGTSTGGVEPENRLICSHLPNGGPDQVQYNYYKFGAFVGLDRSVYGHQAYIIQPVKNTNTVEIDIHKATLAEAPIIYKQIGSKSTAGDMFGDGDEDYTSRLVCPFSFIPGSIECTTGNIKFNPTDDPGTLDALNQYIASNYVNFTEDAAKDEIADNIVLTGLRQGEFFVTRNDSITSGLLASVTKPTHNLMTEWTYQPLSADISDRVDFPLYTVPDRLDDDSYVDEEAAAVGEHFYFNSSMYVVSEMSQTNNYGSHSLNEYAYEEAVYNNQGRGFQGFRKITVKSNPADGSIYETTSASTFHQVFPLAGKLESVTVIQDGVPVNVENYCYKAQTPDALNTCPYGLPKPTIGSIVFHPLVHKNSTNKELNGGGKSSATATDLTYDDYGNTMSQTSTITTYDVLAANTELRSETTTTSNIYELADTNNWWLDKLKKTSITKSSPGNGVAHTSHSSFFWKTGNKRELDCQFTYIAPTAEPTSCGTDININDNNISKNSFVYDNSYGNIIEVTTAATNHAGALSNRIVTTTYSSTDVNNKGYFPISITRANQTSHFEYDIATGQVEKLTQPDDGYIISQYDSYGFKLTDNINDKNNINYAPTSYSAIKNCGSTCAEEQGIVNSIKSSAESNNPNIGLITGAPQLAYQMEQRQNGQPQQLTWYDLANNPVLTKTWHSDGQYNYVVNITSPLGVSEISTQPFVSTANAYSSVTTADTQGRTILKLTEIGDLSDNTNTTADCQLQTIYDHKGGSTDITASYIGNTTDCSVPSAGAGSLGMSRTYDATGKLLTTTDADGNTVSYQYDSSGNPRKLIDAVGTTGVAGHEITTVFDALGRKQSVNDPNMGLKTFAYNGFGEVIRQTDAQGDSTFYQYDTLGRIIRQQSNVTAFDATSPMPLSDTRAYDDSYQYDTEVIGQLKSVSRASNMANNGCPPNITNCFQEHYKKEFKYDEQSRVIKETTSLINALTPHAGFPNGLGNDNASYITQYYYDGNYNRLKQVIYDNSYSVENIYTKYGSLALQKDVITGANLMEVTSWNTKGQETSRTFNNNANLTSETDYYPSTGQIAEIRNSSAAAGLEKLNYKYDVWGNIKQQQLDRDNNLTTGSETATENFVYDQLHRLTNSFGTGVASKTYAYDPEGLGNIKSKSDFSLAYTYGEFQSSCNTSGASNSAPGPNAVSKAILIEGKGTMTYHYDSRGNRVLDCKNGLQTGLYTYDYNNLLVESIGNLAVDQQILEFNYGADNQRYRKYDKINKEITLYANKDYEQMFDSETGQLKQEKYYLTSYLTITKDQQTGTKVNFMQKDRLGSTTQILDEQGFVLHTKSYDAFASHVMVTGRIWQVDFFRLSWT